MSHVPSYDVVIVGAGPGGTATAMFLAKQGIRSVMIDKASFPRDKICGDALSGKVTEVLRKLDPAVVDRIDADEHHLSSYGVVFVAPNTKALHVPFKKDYTQADQAPGFIAKRLDFDHFMVKEAMKYEECELWENTEVREYELQKDGYLLKDKSGNEIVKTKLIIACDGAHSKFGRQVGGIKMEPSHYCAGLRAYYKGVKGLHQDNFIELHFLKDFLPGYFWIFPLPNGMANVGVGMRSDKVSAKNVNLKQRMLEIIQDYPELKDRFEGAEPVGKVQGYGLPLGSKKRSISGERYMLVGDAGSLIDPFTGEGIGNAMMSGMFAAQHAAKCLEAGDFSAEAMAPYDQMVYDRLWPELKLSKRMQEMVKYPWLFNFVVNKATKNKALSEMISCMFEDLDLRERLKKPGFYFRLIFN